jgi:hypothetical protein
MAETKSAPLVLVVFPEQGIANAVCLKLSHAFGNQYVFVQASDIESAYEMLAEWEEQGLPVPLLLVDKPDTFQFLIALLPRYRFSSCLILDREHHEQLAHLIDHSGTHNFTASNDLAEPALFLKAVSSKLAQRPLQFA